MRPPLRGDIPSEHPEAGPIPRAISRVPVRGRRSERRRRFTLRSVKFSRQLWVCVLFPPTRENVSVQTARTLVGGIGAAGRTATPETTLEQPHASSKRRAGTVLEEAQSEVAKGSPSRGLKVAPSGDLEVAPSRILEEAASKAFKQAASRP